MRKPVIGVTTSYEDKNNLQKQHVSEYYLKAVVLGGGEPKVLDFLTPLNELPHVLSGLDGLLLIGGRDVEPRFFGEERLPECGEASEIKDAYEIELTRLAIAMGMPILGICRGIQVINVAMGGTLIQDIPTAIGEIHEQQDGDIFWHDVWIEPDTRLSRLMQTDILATNSYHHQSPKDIAPGLRVSARAFDGVIEAVEGTGESYITGVQWHPERTVAKDRHSARIFGEFIGRSIAYGQNRGE